MRNATSLALVREAFITASTAATCTPTSMVPPSPQFLTPRGSCTACFNEDLQGYLAQKKAPSSLGPPQGSSHRPTVRSYLGALSNEQATPVHWAERRTHPCHYRGRPRNETYLFIDTNRTATRMSHWCFGAVFTLTSPLLGTSLGD